jgi:hypothetical protein
MWVTGTLLQTFLVSTGVWIQSFALARQAFYHLSHTPALFCFYFSDCLTFLPRLVSNHCPLRLQMHISTPSLEEKGVSLTFFAQAGLKPWSSQSLPPQHPGSQICTTKPGPSKPLGPPAVTPVCWGYRHKPPLLTRNFASVGVIGDFFFFPCY